MERAALVDAKRRRKRLIKREELLACAVRVPLVSVRPRVPRHLGNLLKAVFRHTRVDLPRLRIAWAIVRGRELIPDKPAHRLGEDNLKPRHRCLLRPPLVVASQFTVNERGQFLVARTSRHTLPLVVLRRC